MKRARLQLALGLLLAGLPASAQPWKRLEPGLELGRFTIAGPQGSGTAEVVVLRADPERFDLVFGGPEAGGEEAGRTVRQWSQKEGFAGAINAGMFGTDLRTHVGYLRFRGKVHSSFVNSNLSVAAFDPKKEGLPRFRIFDLDQPGVSLKQLKDDYASLVQNLRLIKRPGENRWHPPGRRWGEAALGEDEQGRILFILVRRPFAMHELSGRLLSLPMGLVAAQHLEGGPEAQLYVAAGGEAVEVVGSYDSWFGESEAATWPVPNVLGLKPRARARP